MEIYYPGMTGSSIWECSSAGSADITAVGNVLTGSAFTGSDTSAIKGNQLIFEGNTSVDDAFDVTLQAADVTVSKTYTLPELADRIPEHLRFSREPKLSPELKRLTI